MSIMSVDREDDVHKIFNECMYHDESTNLTHHFHNDYELLYVVDGEADLTVDKKKYRLKKGSLVFLSRYEEHLVDNKTSGYKCYFVLFNNEKIDEIVGDQILTSIFKNRTESFSHVLDMSADENEMVELFEKIYAEYRANVLYSSMLLSLYLKQCLILVRRRHPDAFQEIRTKMDEEIGKIQEYIDINCGEEIKITEIAKSFYVSPQYLSKAFKRRTGYSPKQYLLKIRISKAKSMLINSGMSNQEIAYRVGFGDENNFIRIFKKYENVSPKKYRSNSMEAEKETENR